MAANSPSSSPAPKAPKPSPNDIVRVYNKTRGGFVHGEFSVGPNEYAEVPRKVADIWLSHRSFGAPAVVLASEVPVSRPAEVHALKDDNQKLSEANADLKARLDAMEKLVEQARGAFAEGDKKHPAIQILEAGLKGGAQQ